MSTAVLDPDVALARKWASFYTSRGFNALPMRPDAKRPLVRYAPWWDEPAPGDLFDAHPSSGVQVMCGRRWRLLVLDLDGPAARDWLGGRPVPRTWATHSGGDGLHLWFRLPPGLPHALPKAVLWRGAGEHEAAERLCDHSLIVAPPSLHPTTGRRYRFRSRGESPVRLPLPADCPAWLLALPALAPPRPAAPPPARCRARPVVPGRYRAADVLDAIRDKVGLAEEWGLRVASRRENAAGWCPCHVIGREDRHPSASVSATTGRYWEPGQRPISFFELAVRLGVYLDFRDAVADLGRRFGLKEVA